MVREWVILIGPPGSGKGTLGQWLAQKLAYTHLSTGWLLQHALDDPKLKATVGPIWKSGRLINDQMMLDILFHFVVRKRAKRIVFDGFPRNLIQHRLLETKMRHFQIKTLKIIIFDIDLNLCEERVNNRLICPKCQRVYHTFFLPPQKEGLCDQDAIRLEKRLDDEKIKKRFAVFEKQTLPLQKWYLDHHASNPHLKVLVLNGRFDPQTLQMQVQDFLTKNND